VSRYQSQRAKVKAQEKAIEAFVARARIDVAKALAEQTSHYMMALRKVQLARLDPSEVAKVAQEEKLDTETFMRWGRYLSAPRKIEHPFLKPWFAMMSTGGGSDEEARRLADEFQKLVLQVIAEKTAVIAANDNSRRNYKPDPDEDRAALPGDLMQFERFQYKQLLVEKVMDPHRFYVWLDVVQGEQASQDYEKKDGIYEYQFKTLALFFTADQRTTLNSMLARLKALEKDLPPEYPYLMAISDNPAPANLKLNIRGDLHALGDMVPRGLPAILASAGDDPSPFANGSGRLDLAEAIGRHPLAARVMVNRIWMHHFGRGIVATPSNFGMAGERPTHPELLDYLASRFIESHWSMKAMHREIMLSSTYQLSTEYVEAHDSADPDNQLFWRANLRRLDAEEIRDSLLLVSGAMDQSLGGAPLELSSAANIRRTVYSRIRRSVYVCTSGTGGLDRMLQLFDFPDPAVSVDQRSHTNVPLQGLFFLNSELVMKQAELLAKRLAASGDNDRDRIQKAYRLLFGRPAKEAEVQLGIDFLKDAQQNTPEGVPAWQQYAQALLTSNEFYYVN
jgi:hypothetical protein